MVYRAIAKLYTKKIRKNFQGLLRYANINIDPDKFLGFMLSFGFLLSLALSLNLKGFFNVPFFVVFLVTFIISQASVYFYLSIKIDLKATKIEEILPDALQLMATNLKAGLTTERAVLLAARPEFGPFEDEIHKMGKKLAVGTELGAALADISKRIRSRILEKTMILIKSGLQSGGSLAPLLEQTAENLRDHQMLKKRIRSNVLMYVIFIFIAVSVGSPILFALSSFLVEVIAKNIASIEIPPEATTTIDLPFTLNQVRIDAAFILPFIITFIVTNTIFGSFIVGLINKGRERAGIKYMPLILLISFSLFFLIRYILRTVFADLFGF